MEDEFDKNVINLTRDYKYDEDEDGDFEDISLSERENLIINGNNHTIDLGNHSVLFDMSSSKVELNNIIIKNFYDAAILADKSVIISKNITYINEIDTDFARAVKLTNSTFDSYNDRFIDNYIKGGASIYATDNSTIYLENSTFTNKHHLDWGVLYVSKSDVNIVNSTFSNITSDYSPAIYMESSTANLTGSSFINLKANKSAGAIAVRRLIDDIDIYNCTFINTTSQKNAGAILIDRGSAGEEFVELAGEVTLINSRFENCSSQIAGAYVQFDGILTMNNTIFKNNHAEYAGGAVYTSYANVSIFNSTFEDNKVLNDMEDYSDGGALYVDECYLKLNNSKFIKNNANNGQSIYIYDASYEIENSQFDGNIHTFFEKSSKMNNNTFTGKENVLNDTFNPTYYEGNGTIINYNPVELDETLVNSTYFNLADYGLVSPVKNQGSMGACAAFGTVAALESAFLKASNKTVLLDISENNAQSSELRYSKYGDNESTEGVDTIMTASYFTSWLGVTSNADDSYDELSKLSPVYDNGTKYHVHDVIFINKLNNITDNHRIKEALLKYGGLATSLYGASNSNEGYNPNTSASYVNDSSDVPDHCVCIVGWDDAFSKEKFIKQPPADGAWIIKNSWGTGWGDKGLFYVSYYDTSFAKDTLVAFTVDNTNNYERNYQYDYIGFPDFTYKPAEQTNISYYNIYTVAENELISAVGTYFTSPNVNYTITITREDNDTYIQQGISTHNGFQTIKLNKTFAVKQNQTVTVKITSNAVPTFAGSRLKYDKNMTFIERNGTVEDLQNTGKIACIKMYTITDHSQIEADNLTTQYNTTNYLQAKFYDENGEILTNTEVQFIINNKSYTKTTDENGVATLDENLNIGNYTVTIVNPIGQNKMNVNLNILPNEDDKQPTLKVDTTTFTIGQNNIIASIYYDDDIATDINKGKITFKVNGKTLKDAAGKVIYAKVVNGQATIENYEIPVEWNKAGSTIQAVYSGSTQCDKLNSEKTNIMIIAEQPTIVITPITEDIQTGSNITLKAKVQIGSQPITNGKIVFKINGKSVKDANGKVIYAKLDSNGEVSLDYNIGNLKAGSYTVEAVFISSDYDRISSNTTMTVVKSG